MTGGTKPDDQEYEERCKVGNVDDTMVEPFIYDAVVTEIKVTKESLESKSEL